MKADVMCTKCQLTRTEEVDMDTIAGHASALAWARHFAADHPGVRSPLEHLVILPTDEPTEQEKP